MPVANIHLIAGRPRAVLHELLREVSRTYADVLASPVDRVQVWITEVDPDLVALGGVPAVELSEDERAAREIPLARLVMMQDRPVEQVHRAITELTAVIARVLDVEPERVRVEAQSIAAERWGIGGVPASVKRQAEIAARAAHP
ncbi:MAG: tautomerase family protein [Acidimicrobiales bacterium]|nr:tautomerase family protein [Acidimicrobiales bacterium]MCB9396153.1 tautomerase family protein [Acidimicrobiaceae bacterium]